MSSTGNKVLSVQVLRRADASRKEVKVVVDGRQLRHYRRVQRGSADTERQYSVEEIHQDDIERGVLVEMDSIPEDLTVSVDARLASMSEPRRYTWMSGTET
ncbi:unnamed protein product, partial [Strongylus vulgaris]